MLYFFILGHNPTLSTAEIIRTIGPAPRTISEITPEFLILDTEEPLVAEKLQTRLGGVVKIGTVIGEADSKKDVLLEKITAALIPREEERGKVNFGFSFYGRNGQDRLPKAEKMALEVKKHLKRKNISSRWIVSPEGKLSSAAVKKNLLNQGREIVFLTGREKILWGRTLSCQPFEEYGDRDFNRPVRVIEKGMIPPKLARIMINLGADSDMPIRRTCFLDPFCGTGTILQEAFLMGFGQIIGTDKNQRIVADAQKNLAWLAEKTHQKEETGRIRIFHSDARKLSARIKEGSVGLVATEPYLGPVRFDPSTWQFVIKELSRLYFLTFRELETVVKKDGRVVMIFPVFRISGKNHFLQILDQLKKIGWQIKSPLPAESADKGGLEVTERNSMIYSRPDQTVLREIFIFEKHG